MPSTWAPKDLLGRWRGRQPGRLRSAAGGVPAVVWAVTALHVCLLAGYAVLMPTYRAPDEPQHVDLAHAVSQDFHYPAWDEKRLEPGVQRTIRLMQFSSRSAHLQAADAIPKGQRPAIDDYATEGIPTSVNQLPQHPPLYYLLEAGAVRTAEAVVGDPIGSFDLETLFYRLVSVALVAPLPLIIWNVCRRLRAPPAVGVAAAVIPLAIPQLDHSGSAVNNDSLMWLMFWLLTPVVIRMADGELRPRTAALAGTLTGLALLTKGFALVLPLWVAAVLLVALARLGRARLGTVVRAGAVYGAVALATGGWWWVRNLVLYGEISPSRWSDMVPTRDGAPIKFDTFLHRWSLFTTRRFWGDFGWFDVHIPGPAVAVATGVVLVAVVLCCTRPDRVAGTPVGTRLLLAAPLLLLVVVQTANAFRGYLQTGKLPGLQGRYWFGALAAMAAAVVLGLANLPGLRRHVHRLPLALFAGAAVMQVLGVTTILGYYWAEPGAPLSAQVRAAVAWSPLPGEVLAAGCALAVLVAVVTAGLVTWVALRPPPAEPADGSDAAAGRAGDAPTGPRAGADGDGAAEPSGTGRSPAPVPLPAG